MEKLAVKFLSADIVRVVLESRGLMTPSPVHPAKEYPVLGVAEIEGDDPYSKEPLPETDPPSPDRIERSYELMEKEAEIVLFCVIATVVEACDGSVTPSPVHPAKEYPVSGVAEIFALAPLLKVPDPVTDPPLPASTVRL